MDEGTGSTFGRLTGLLKGNVVLVVSAVLAVASMAIVPPSSGYLDYIDVRMLCILFCFMAVVAGMRDCNLFGTVAGRILAGRHALRTLCLVLVLLPFFCSMFITNDVALITFVPFTIIVLSMADERGSILPVVVLQTVAANLGSMGRKQALICSANLRRSIDALADKGTERPAARALKIDEFGRLYIRELEHALHTIAVIAVTRHRVLLKVDYGLLLTFVFLFVFTGNIAHVDTVSSALGSLMSWDPMLASLGVSQVISNVPAATLLSGFTTDWQDLLVGVDIGGFGTPIASMASMISLGIYSKVEGADTGRYLVLFTAVNILMIVLLVPVNYLLS